MNNPINSIARLIAPGVACLQSLMVNLCLVGDSKEWVLVDAGLSDASARIMQAAEELFGESQPPQAIVLTQGHFDHVGAIPELVKSWDIPVYAHKAEIPYITGKTSYPPADPSVGGGLMSRISPLYPRDPIDLGQRVKPLSEDGSVPHMPGWRWIHTPGHTPGHVSFFRDSDRVLIAGDAFTTVKQESALAVITQTKEVHGPPAYFTTNWAIAKDSVRKLHALDPAVVVTGHGQPMVGEELKKQLEILAQDFDEVALPEQGRYVENPLPLGATAIEERPRA